MGETTRKLRKQPIARLNPWNFDLEPGDRVFELRPDLGSAYIYDLIESTGRNKRAAGELVSRLVKKSGQPRLAELRGDCWYWQ